MQPVTFEDAREAMIWEGIERGLREATKIAWECECQAMLKAHRHWQYHWRTRLSSWLHSLASKVELPEPPLP